MKEDDPRQIIISKIIEHRENNASQSEYSTSVSPVSRWLFYLALIPVTIIVFFVGFSFLDFISYSIGSYGGDWCKDLVVAT